MTRTLRKLFGDRLGAGTRRRPQVVLHVGRNKAGSTTIQDFCIAARCELGLQGVDYALFGHLADSVPGVSGFATFEGLVAHASAHPNRTFLISNEFMFGWPDAYTRAAAEALAGCDVRVFGYIRPYESWIVSAYAEETRKGMNTRDIDTYLAGMASRISAWPHLKVWGECFGWDRMRLRALDAASLHGGDLVADFVHALGVSPTLSLAPSRDLSNASPHWTELELVRRLAMCDGDVEWVGVAADEAEPLVAALLPIRAGVPQTPYLTRAQRTKLAALYNADLNRIAVAGGGRMPGSAPRPEAERAFVPSWDTVPQAVSEGLRAVAASQSFAREYPAAAARARGLTAGALAPQR